MIDKIFPKIHLEGYKFLAISIFATILLYLFSTFLGLIGFILTIWVYYFFRDPERVSINDDNFLTSPADGEVLMVHETNGPKELGLENKRFNKISIFMNVFDCHVNRSPCKGKVEEIFYKPGKFFNASLDKASEENERNYYKIINSNGENIIVVQIAGLIARRIVSDTVKDQELKQGERIGMIRFGSRADIYYENYNPLVKVGQKTIAGETLFKVCYPKSFKNSNRFGVSTLLIMVKRGHEVDLEYSKKNIINKMNSFFGYFVVEKLKFTSFDDENILFKKNYLQKNVTNKRYHKKVNDVKNEKIRKSLMELTKVFKKK